LSAFTGSGAIQMSRSPVARRAPGVHFLKGGQKVLKVLVQRPSLEGVAGQGRRLIGVCSRV
jgi:hypothetical protein